MPAWRKVILSGSAATLNQLYVTGSVTASAFSASAGFTGSLLGTAQTASFAQTASYLNPLSQSLILSGALTLFGPNTNAYAIRTQNNSLILEGNAGGNSTTAGQLRITANNGAWTDNLTAAYFQLKTTGSFGSNNNVVFQGGTWADDAPFSRLQFASYYTSFNNSAYGTTPIPSASVEIINTNSATASLLQLKTLVAQTANYINITSGSTTASGSVFNITKDGIVAIGTTRTNPESNLFLGGLGTDEGGQITLQAGTSYTSGAMLDNWQDTFRILRGNATQSNASVASWNLTSRQMNLAAYTSLGSFSGTAVANLAVNSSGDVITVSAGASSAFPYTGSAQITGSLGVTGSVNSTGGFTGSISASSLQGAIINSQLLNSSVTVGNTAISLGSSATTIAGIVSLTTTGLTASFVSASGGVTGSLLGTSSWSNTAINALTASNLNPLSQSVVTLNAGAGSRYPGFVVIDSGSSNLSGSLSFDSVNNNWLFIHSQTGGGNTPTSSLLIMGPETYGNIGNETKLTANRIPKSNGDEHIADSNIFDDGTNIQITGSSIILSGSSTALIVTGSVRSLGGFTGSISASSLQGSIINSQLLNSSVTVGSTAISLGGSATTIAGIVSLTSTGITGSFISASGGLTGSLTASSLIGSITNTQLQNSSVTIGTTAVSLGGSSTTIGGLTSLLVTGSAILSGSTGTEFNVIGEALFTGSVGVSGSMTFTPSGSLTIVSGSIRALSLTGSLTASSLVGSITNTQLQNSSVTVGNTAIALGASATTITGLTSVTSTNFVGTASYVTGSIFTGANQATSASYAITASYALTSAGGGGVTGTGTTNRHAKFSAASTIADSLIFDDGTNIQITGSSIIVSGAAAVFRVTGSVNSLGGFTGSISASALQGSIINSQLLNSSVTVGSTAISLGTSATTIAGIVSLTATGITGSFISASGGLTGSLTASSLIGAITNTQLQNSSVTVGNTAISLGGSSTTIAGLTSLTVTGSITQQTGSAFFPTLNASESLSAGDFINITASFVRRASSNDTTKQAHGFVITSVASGSAATIYYNGIYVTGSAGITVGARYFISTSGTKSTAAPLTTGQLSQEIGVGVSTTSMLVNIGPAIIT